jgi:predicted transcriptional regulator
MTSLSDLQDQLDAANEKLDAANEKLDTANEKNKRLESRLSTVQCFADHRARTEVRMLRKLPALYQRHSGAVPRSDMFDFVSKQFNDPTPSPPTSDDDDS